MFAELVTIDGEVNRLDVVEGDAPVEDEVVAPAPMSSFSFAVGADSDCSGELPSGLLVQTPEGFKTPEIMRAVFDVNDIRLELGSTVWAQAEPDGSLNVSTLEGEAFAKQEGTIVYIPEGMEGNVPSDGPIEPLEFPEPVVGFIEGLSRAEGLVNPAPTLNEVMDEGTLVEMLENAGYDPESGRFPRLAPGYWLYWTLGRMETGACLGVQTGEDMFVGKLEDSYVLDDERNFLAYIEGDGAVVAFDHPDHDIYIYTESPAEGITFEYHLQIVDAFMVTGTLRGGLIGLGPTCESVQPFTWVSCETAAWRKKCLELAN